MSNINKQALRIPERKKHNWGQAVMRDCDFCQQWALTVQNADGGCICASCCDSEYTSDLKVTLATALEQLEAAEKRIAELEERNAEILRQARTFREAHESASEIIRRMERGKPVVTLPTTRLWAGKVPCFEEEEIISSLVAAGIITNVGE